MQCFFMSENSYSKKKTGQQIKQQGTCSSEYTHINILVNHFGEVDTNKYLKYSNCCDVSDSV